MPQLSSSFLILIDHINNSKNINELISFFSPSSLDAFKIFSSHIHEKSLELIQSTDDFEKIIFSLDQEKRKIFLSYINKDSLNFIKSIDDLKRIFSLLNLEEFNLLLSRIYEKSLELIQSTDNFEKIILSLDQEKCKIFLSDTNKDLLGFIKSTDDLNKILSFITPEECTILLSRIHKKLLELIEKTNDIDSIKQRLSKLIQIRYNLKNIFPNLKDDNYEIILNDAEKKLSGTIKIISCSVEFFDIREELKKIELYKINDLISSQRKESNLADDSTIKDILPSDSNDFILNKTLLNINNFIASDVWDTQGISFFSKKVPAGIQEIRKSLVSKLDSPKTDQEKFEELREIIHRKNNSSSWFRSERTKDFYTKLYIIFNDYRYLHQENTEQLITNRLSR